MHSLFTFIKQKLNILHAHSTSLIFPPLCLGCRHYGEKRNHLCISCKNALEPIVSHNISITKKHTITIYACTRYKGIIQKLIRLKNYKQPQGSYILGNLIAEQYTNQMHDVSYILPVPLHWTRKLWRGFNQAENIAHICSTQWNIPIAHIVVRTKKTPQLAKFSKAERELIIAHSFTLSPQAIKNKDKYKGAIIAIVDDLYTSGSTIREMSTILYTLGVKEIRVIVAARTC